MHLLENQERPSITFADESGMGESTERVISSFIDIDGEWFLVWTGDKIEPILKEDYLAGTYTH